LLSGGRSQENGNGDISRQKGEAATYPQQQNTLLLNEGRNGVEFPSWLRLSAQRAYETLLPWGKTIEDALQFYVSYLEKAKKSAPLQRAVDELIAVRQQAGSSKRYCYDLKIRLGRFCGQFQNKTTADISTRDMDSWLASLGVGPATRNTYRRDLRTLFSFRATRGYVANNPATRWQKAKEVDSPIGILTPEQLERLLENAVSETIAYIAIGAFAGLRSAEIERLDWSEVDLIENLIHVSAKNSKTATRRLVKILPNLAAWQQPFAGSNGAVSPRNLRAHILESRRRAKIVLWPPNALRHSYASYHIAHFNDAKSLALELGHTHERLIFRHYREIVKPADAKRYWQIVPQRKASRFVLINSIRSAVITSRSFVENGAAISGK
jgi:integrase